MASKIPGVAQGASYRGWSGSGSLRCTVRGWVRAIAARLGPAPSVSLACCVRSSPIAIGACGIEAGAVMADIVGSSGTGASNYSRAVMTSVMGSRGTMAASHAGPVMAGVPRSGREPVPGKEHVKVPCVHAAMQVLILRRACGPRAKLPIYGSPGNIICAISRVIAGRVVHPDIADPVVTRVIAGRVVQPVMPRAVMPCPVAAGAVVAWDMARYGILAGRRFMIAKDFVPLPGIRSFAIMEKP